MKEDFIPIYEGAYYYYSMNREYSHETFKVFKNYNTHELEFETVIMTRVANGEFFRNEIFYTVNKDFIPVEVDIHKTLGTQTVKESYAVDNHSQALNYSFFNGEDLVEEQLSLPPKFHISTPASCTSFLFYNSKKFDLNGLNFYNVIKSTNRWEYQDLPTQCRLIVKPSKTLAASIKIGKNNLQANHYLVRMEDDKDEIGPINVYASKHMAIPYKVTGPRNVKIEIDFLKDLDQEKMGLL